MHPDELDQVFDSEIDERLDAVISAFATSLRVCPAGASDLGKISQEDVTCYIEVHARDRSAASGKGISPISLFRGLNLPALGVERRDCAILMMLAKVGLQADEVATLTRDDITGGSADACPRRGSGAGVNAAASRRRRSCRWVPRDSWPTSCRCFRASWRLSSALHLVAQSRCSPRMELLRSSCRLLGDRAVARHESLETKQTYLHAHLALKEAAFKA